MKFKGNMVFTLDASMGKSQRVKTKENFLKTKAVVSKTGVQDYLTKEVIAPEHYGQVKDINTVLKIYRPPNAVFDKESLAGFKGAVVTNGHPETGLVDSNSFKKYSCGTVMSEGTRDGDYVTADLLINDQEVIDAIENNEKCQVSVGYSCNYSYDIDCGKIVPPKDYVLDSKEQANVGAYDVIQSDIKVNHVAIVRAGRAGSSVRVCDSKIKKHGDSIMKLSLTNGAAVSIDESNGEVILKEFSCMKDTIDSKSKEIDSLKQKLQESETKLGKNQVELEAKDSEIENLKKLTTHEAINEKVKEVSLTLENAKKIAGDSFVCDSTDPVEIKKQALNAVGSTILEDKCKEYIDGAFDAQLSRKKDSNITKDEASNYKKQCEALAKDALVENESLKKAIEKQNKELNAFDKYNNSLKGK